MKKLGLIIFIVAIAAGVILSNVFSFAGFSIGSPISFSIGSKVVGSGDIATEQREISDFTELEVSGIFVVEVVSQKETAITIEADENLLSLIRTDVRDGVLKIEAEKKFSSKNSIKIRVATPNIEKIDNSGVSKVTVSNLENDELQIESSGASKVIVSGSTKDLNLDLSGASRIDASGLNASKVSVDSSGASSATINVETELSADLSGASRVSYKGSPEHISKKVSGASRVSQLK